jgi:hypothetical protein
MVAGYQGNVKTSAELVVYSHGDDPILLRPQPGRQSFLGRQSSETEPALINLTTSKALGGTASEFSALIKVPKSRQAEFEQQIADDDWVDIRLLRAGRAFHWLRGIVDNITVEIDASAGPTVYNYLIRGREFQKILDTTEIWFNTYSNENLVGGANFQAASAGGAIFGDGSPFGTVRGYVFGFLEVLNSLGRELWDLPASIPGMQPGATFRTATELLDLGDANNPKRQQTNSILIENVGHQTLWSLAQEYCDPQFNELFCDLVQRNDSQIAPELPSDIGDTKMAIIIRRRPFPTGVDQPISESAWFHLPTIEVAEQDVQTLSLCRSGAERKNTIQLSPILNRSIMGPIMDLTAPLVDELDIRRHGVRFLEVQSRYLGTEGSSLVFAEKQRDLVRDFVCLNPYFWSGVIALPYGRPDIRVGTRLRVVGADRTTTFYVESVRQNWSQTRGLKTSLSVTRGWVGDDGSLVEALFRTRTRYRILIRATAV